MTKLCPHCEEEKPLSEFGRRGNGHQSWCKACMRAYYRADRAEQPDKYRRYDKARYDRDPEAEKQRRRAVQIKIRYGLTLQEYEDMVAAGCCICDSHPDESQIVMDHDHETGNMRGALCKRCNILLGYAKDDPGLLRLAAAYLDKHQIEELSP